MEPIRWDDSLSVGIDLIDEQHKTLIARIIDLSQAIDRHQGVEKILKTLDFLIEYTDYHFSTEEKNMVNFHYPGYDEHKKAHAELITTLGHLDEDFQEEGATQALAESINVFLVNWLVKHIKGIDIKFGEFLTANCLVFCEDE